MKNYELPPIINLSITLTTTMKIITIIVIALFTIAAYASTCKGKPNPYPLIEPNFTKVEVHQFGEKHHYFSKELNQNYYILKLWGNSYQAGIAYGSLMKK